MLIQTLSRRNGNRRGFTLIELAIVLAITALLTVGLWRMMSSANTEMRDQAVGDQHKQLINAVRAYLASTNGQAWMTANIPASIPPNNRAGLAIPAACPAAGTLCDFLPAGFTSATRNSYDQQYEVRVRRDSASSYSFMIKTTGGEVIPDTSGGRISSVIGADGGFVYTADVCGANNACGAFGTWQAAPVGVYGFDASAVAGGQVASRTFIGTDATAASPWLARIAFGVPDVADGISTFNKLHTEISMNGQTIWGDKNDYDGSIENLNTLRLGTVLETGNIPLDVVAPCDQENRPPVGPACDVAANFDGDVSVLGRLTANALYGARYIYNVTSDINLKKDIKPIEKVLDKFAKVKGYTFVLKNTGEEKYGVIAQEVEKVFPNVVHPIESGYKGVDYMGLVGPLVAAVNELREQNMELRKELDQLKARQK